MTHHSDDKVFKQVLKVLIENGLIRAKEQMADATLIPTNIGNPTDCKLLNEAREWLCGMILRVKREAKIKEQVRTYRRVGRRVYMEFTKMCKRKRRYVRRLQEKLLRFVRRSDRQIEELLERVPDEMMELREKVAQKVAVIRCLYG